MPDSEPESSAVVVPEDRDLSRVPEHLRKYCIRPGVSGNPGGQPKDMPITFSGLMKKVMRNGGSEVAVKSALTILANPNHRHWLGAFRDIIDRTVGKVTEKIQHEMKKFDEGVELKDGRLASGPVPLPRADIIQVPIEKGAIPADDPSNE